MIDYGTDYPDTEDWVDEDGTVHGSSGAQLLDDLAAFLSRFVAFPSDSALTATALWAAHTHLMACFENTPRLALLSPEPGSGKTRTLEVLELLCPEPMHVLNASPAAIFRTIQRHPPTLLLDEVDTVFTRKGKDDEHADLRGLLNSGYRTGATIPRCVGPRHDVAQFPTYCAVALAGLGDLPDTLMTRSVVIRMRRRAPGEKVESFRRRLHRHDGEDLCKRLAEWADQIREKITGDYPTLPAGITDRPADVWEPLLSIADTAGGDWRKRARAACVELVKAARSSDSGSLGVRLLTDLRAVFGDADKLGTETILAKLNTIPEAPWCDLRGKPLDARGLANRLKAYGVTSTKVKIDEASVRGYRREDLHDPWQRYLSTDPAEAEPTEPPEHSSSEDPDQVPDRNLVPEPEPEAEPEAHPLTCTVPEVPLVPHSARQGSAGNGTARDPVMAAAVDVATTALGATPLNITDDELWRLHIAPGYDR